MMKILQPIMPWRYFAFPIGNLLKITFVYHKLESMLDRVHCKLIWNDLRVNVFQIWWAQLEQQAACFQTFPFSGTDIQFNKYLLKHVMWEGLKQSDIASMTPAGMEAVLRKVPPQSVCVWCGTPFWFARYREILVPSLPFTASCPLSSCTSCTLPGGYM